MENKMIVLTTDFGNDVYVGQMKAVIKSINPNVEIIDLTHEIQPQNLSHAALVISSSYKFFPKGSIFVCVVDPGVGSKRDIVLLTTNEYIFIAPNNGILTAVVEKNKNCSFYKVVNSKFFLSPVSNTFHGRDIFAPVAAYLSKGVSINEICQKYDKSKFVYLKEIKPLCKILNNRKVFIGQYVYHDRFGNIITNLEIEKIKKSKKLNKCIVKVFFKNVQIYNLPLRQYYSEVKEGEPIAYVNSFGFIEVAINKGNLVEKITREYGNVKEMKFYIFV